MEGLRLHRPAPVAIGSKVLQDAVLLLMGQALNTAAIHKARAALLEQQLRGSFGVQTCAQSSAWAACRGKVLSQDQHDIGMTFVFMFLTCCPSIL